MPRGSAPGERRGGRQVGTLNRDKQKVIDEAKAKGVLPLDVMLDNMNFYHSSAEQMMLDLKQRAFNVEDEDERHELIKAINNLLVFRDKAEGCAVDAAPYLHSKLAQITVLPKQPGDDAPLQIAQNADRQTVARLYADMLKRNRQPV